MKNLNLSTIRVMLFLFLFTPLAYSQQEPEVAGKVSDAYFKFIMAKKQNQRNIIDLDSIHVFGHSTNGYVLNYRLIHSSDYVNGIFSCLTLWDIGAGWTNLELMMYEADTSKYQVRYSFNDSYQPGYGWLYPPFAEGLIQYDTLFRQISDSVVMKYVFLKVFGERFYDNSGRLSLIERQRSILNISSQTWGPKHYFDSLRYQYHSNTDSIELVTRYSVIQPSSRTQTWYTYTNKQVVQLEDMVDLTGSFTENSLTQFFYDQDNDMVIRLYKRWDTAAQAYLPYDSVVYSYYLAPLAQYFYVDWLVTNHYPDFGVETKLVREVKRFIYSPGNGYKPSVKHIYYYNVPGLSISSSEKPETNFSIYPNPSSDHIYIYHNIQGGRCALTVYSADGRLMMNRLLDSDITRVSTSHFPQGIYLYRITNDNYCVGSGKLIITH